MLLNPARSVYSVLGCLCKNTELLRQPNIRLDMKDFYKPLDQLVFSTIYNIAFTDYEIKEITAIDIDNYLSQYPQQYKIYEQYNGYKYVDGMIRQTNLQTFKVNYERVKKFSLLRHYQENGFNVSDLFNCDEEDFAKVDEAIKRIDGMSEDDIIQHYTLKAINVRDEWDNGIVTNGFKVGDKVAEVVNQLGQSPVYGQPYYWNKYFNTLFRGKLRGRMMLSGADSGSGKSRLLMSNATESACEMIYDYGRKNWVYLQSKEPTLYISTELDEQEVITIMLAHLSGVSQGIIEQGEKCWSEDTKNRIMVAQSILSASPIYIEVLEDFSINDIELLIEKHIVEHGVVNVYFDYIKETAKANKQIREVFGSDMKTYQILARFTDQLKRLCEKYNIYMETAVQLNSNTESYDGSRLAGSRGQQNMVDFAKLMFVVDDKLLKITEKMRKVYKDLPEPNYCHMIFKNRKGLKNIIIWTKMNLGCYREEVCFITDYMGNLRTDIKPLDLIVEEEKGIDF